MKLNTKSVLVSISLILLSATLGCVFLFSAFTKLFPVELFEYQLVGDHLAGWDSASYLARAIIGIELFFGIALLFSFDYKRWIIRSSFAMLVVFTIFLLVTLVTRGNEPDCNCFGMVLKMSVTQSIIKNIILLSGMGILWRYRDGYNYKYPLIIGFTALGIIISLPFIINPISKTFSHAADQNDVNFKLDLNFLYTDSIYKRPPVDLMKGKHVVAFLSLTCSHCENAAYKFGVIAQRNPKLPIYFILNGDSSELKPFFDFSKSDHIPWNMVKGSPFVELSGLSLPAIYFVNNGIVEKRISYIDLTDDSITTWLHGQQ